MKSKITLTKKDLVTRLKEVLPLPVISKIYVEQKGDREVSIIVDGVLAVAVVNIIKDLFKEYDVVVDEVEDFPSVVRE